MSANILVLENASVVLDDSGGTPVDISSQVQSVSVNLGLNTEVTSAMGDTSEVNSATLKTGAFTLNVFAEFGANKVSSLLNGLYTNRSSGTIVVKKDSGAVSASNPSYTAEVILTSFSAIDGNHGGVLQGSADFVLASGNVLIGTT